MTRIIRVSPTSALKETDASELRRIYGEGTRVIDVSTLHASPQQVVNEIRKEQPDAVFLDLVGPPHSSAIRKLVNEYPILESHTELVLAPEGHVHRGSAVHQRRLGQRTPAGEIESLRNNASPTRTHTPNWLQPQRGDDDAERVRQFEKERQERLANERDDDDGGYDV